MARATSRKHSSTHEQMTVPALTPAEQSTRAAPDGQPEVAEGRNAGGTSPRRQPFGVIRFTGAAVIAQSTAPNPA